MMFNATDLFLLQAEVQLNFQKRRGHGLLSVIRPKFSGVLGEALDIAARWSGDVVSFFSRIYFSCSVRWKPNLMCVSFSRCLIYFSSRILTPVWYLFSRILELRNFDHSCNSVSWLLVSPMLAFPKRET